MSKKQPPYPVRREYHQLLRAGGAQANAHRQAVQDSSYPHRGAVPADAAASRVGALPASVQFDNVRLTDLNVHDNIFQQHQRMFMERHYIAQERILARMLDAWSFAEHGPPGLVSRPDGVCVGLYRKIGGSPDRLLVLARDHQDDCQPKAAAPAPARE